MKHKDASRWYGVSFDLTCEANSPHPSGVQNACVSCHMAEPPQGGPGITEPPTVGSHSFSMRDAMGTEEPSDDIVNVENACVVCHPGLTDYDRTARGDYDGNGLVAGIQTEVRALLEILRTGILATMPGTSVAAETGKIEIVSAEFSSLSPNQRRALYNYNFVREDGSFGIHNTSYAVQLLQRSYSGVFNRPFDRDFPQAALRGPVPGESRVNGWRLYEPEPDGDHKIDVDLPGIRSRFRNAILF
ncbi:hypothetical protein IIC65_08770 [Candidatus Sumerlaeota bacterium]|nr:hypothetical protein [Candidatus Sumerlaeota bacterium]